MINIHSKLNESALFVFLGVDPALAYIPESIYGLGSLDGSLYNVSD